MALSLQKFDHRRRDLRIMNFVCKTNEQLWMTIAEWLGEQINESLKTQKRFHIAIPGGKTPELLYRYLAGPGGDCIPWEHVHIWWTDERVVPPTDSRSNYQMTYNALLGPRRIPSSQIHRVHTELEARRAAVLYAIELEDSLCRRFTSIPFFDLVLLGVGEDGHIASLFPHGEVEEPHPWSVMARYEGLQRISLPYEVIGAAARVAYLVTGERKKRIVSRVLRPQNGEDEDLPAAILNRRRPDMVWFMDMAAGYSMEGAT